MLPSGMEVLAVSAAADMLDLLDVLQLWLLKLVLGPDGQHCGGQEYAAPGI